MRAGLVTGKERFELVDVADPAPGPGEAVVQIARCGVCGSDVHAYQEGWPYAAGICGHEWVGRVVDVGADVPERLVVEGARVVGTGQAAGCGQCAECRAGMTHFCRPASSEYAGRNSPGSGGFAPYLTLSAARLVVVADGATDDQLALVEPASVAMHAVRRSRLAVGDVVCVVGCGPIGLMAVQCARLAGAGRVVAVEPSPSRQQLALAIGADVAVAPGEELRAVVNDLTGGLRADIAFDCAGIPQTLQQSVDMVRQGGSVCMVGVTGGQATIEPMRWMMKEVSVDTSIRATLDELAICADLISSGCLLTDGFVGGTVELDELPSLVDDLANRRVDAVKILVDPTGG